MATVIYVDPKITIYETDYAFDSRKVPHFVRIREFRGAVTRATCCCCWEYETPFHADLAVHQEAGRHLAAVWDS